MRILAVDDDQDYLDMLATLFERTGIDLVLCTSGSEALQWIDRERFDVVLVDLVMPVMDGCALARRIRRRAKHTDLPIVMMTNVSNVARIPPATADDANHFVSKSGAASALVPLVRSLAGRRAPHERSP